MADIAAAEAADPLVHPGYGTAWWLHDEPVERVVLVLHGYTNNPRQYAVLAPELFADGHNVIAPRFPYHGYRDRLTTDIAAMRAEDWLRCAIEAYALAAQAGRRVVVVGISVAASLAAWLAAYFPVHHAIALSPFTGVRFFSGRAHTALEVAMRTVPDQFLWWDPVREIDQLPLHAYPRFSLHTLASTLRIGDTLTSLRSDAHGDRVTLVLNAHEPIVNNRLARERFAGLPQRGVRVEMVERSDFPKRHDVIEPALPGGPDPGVYKLIRELVASV